MHQNDGLENVPPFEHGHFLGIYYLSMLNFRLVICHTLGYANGGSIVQRDL